MYYFCLYGFFFFLDLKGQIDSLARDYTANARSLSSEQKLSLLRQIQQSYGKCKEFGDDKVQLAMQTYEMVGLFLLCLLIITQQYNCSFLNVGYRQEIIYSSHVKVLQSLLGNFCSF